MLNLVKSTAYTSAVKKVITGKRGQFASSLDNSCVQVSEESKQQDTVRESTGSLFDFGYDMKNEMQKKGQERKAPQKGHVTKSTKLID